MKPTPHYWDVARTAKTHAVRTTVQIDPTLISKRIKNKLKRWLVDGKHPGIYGHTRGLAELLFETFELPSSRRSWYGLSVKNPSREMADELLDILKADWAAYVLENPTSASGWQRNQFMERVRSLNMLFDVDRIYFLDHTTFYSQAVKVVEKHEGDQFSAGIKQALDALDGTEPIHCFTYQG